jgi:diadenylate cyclase
LIAIERGMTLEPYATNGERLNFEIVPGLIRAVFGRHSPLHDGAMILSGGRITAAACQLPLSQVLEKGGGHHGMRHRAALCTSEETDAVLVVVSEETGCISLAVGGRLEPVPRENLSRRLVSLLSANSPSTRAE